MNLHKILFPSYENELKGLRDRNDEFENRCSFQHGQITSLKIRLAELEERTPNEMENIMRASLGLPYIRFDNVETDARGFDNPPHYLKGLDQQARLTYISELAVIFRNPHFQEVMNYHINVLGNHSMQKAADSEMRNGRIGIIALRGFRKEFDTANAEYMESKKEQETFDAHSVLSE